MKQLLLTLIVAFAATCTFAQKTSELRYNYVVKNLKLDKAALAKVEPVLKAYIKEMKQAGDIYDDVKDKYKSAIKNNTLTNAQAASLNKAKLDADAKEVEVRRAYYPKFKAVMSEKQLFYTYRLCADKKSKFMDTKSKSDDDED